MSTAALRKASTSLVSIQTETTNLLPYEPGLRESGLQPSSATPTPAGWQRSWVLKYGGSSVGSRLPRVCESVFEHVGAASDAARGGSQPQVAVVVSAMGKTTDLLLDAAQAAKDGNLQEAMGKVQQIRSLADNNALQALSHFGVPQAELQKATEEVRGIVAQTLQGLEDYLRGVSLLKDLSGRTLDAILSNGERVSAAVMAKVLETIVKCGRARGQANGLWSKGCAEAADLKPIYVEATTFMATDESFGQAQVDFEVTREQLRKLVEGWPPGALPVITGFVGRSSTSGATTTLGRNGSDYTAALVAAALSCEQVIINTDVPGVFTADPRLVPDAFPVPQMSYTEAVELSIYGSKIFHPKTMLPLMRHGVPMVIRNTNDEPGAPSTLIKDPEVKRGEAGEDDELEAPRRVGSLMRVPSMAACRQQTPSPPPSARQNVDRRAADADVGAVCIASLEDLSFLTVRAEVSESSHTDVTARAARALERAGLQSIWSDQRSGNDTSILVRRSDRPRAAEVLLAEFSDQRLLELSATEPVTLLSLVPKQEASRVAAASRFFTSLAKANVKIHRVVCGASTASISCLIDARETSLAVRTAHGAFNFARRTVSLVLIGDNFTSRGLLAELQKRRAEGRDHILDIRLCAVLSENGGALVFGDGRDGPPSPALAPAPDPGSGSFGPPQRAVRIKAEGLKIPEVLEALKRTSSDSTVTKLSRRDLYVLFENQVLGGLRRLPMPVLVDCNRFPPKGGEESTSISQMSCYLQCLQAGVRVAISNSATLNSFAGALRLSGQAPPKPYIGFGDLLVTDSTGIAVLRERRGLLRYDSAVAAGLPVLQMIRDQVSSGRPIAAVQGAMSATVGMILDRIGRGNVSLRQAVEEAFNSGITEPNIISDLSGDDVAEKLRVIAFALGCDLPPERIIRDPPLFPPEYLVNSDYPKGLFEALEVFDAKESFAKRAAEAFQQGRRWRFLATLELDGRGGAKASIIKEEVSEEHFTFLARCQEIVFALWEEPVKGQASEYGPTLVVRGQGAGKAAGEGVLSDVVRLVGL